MNDEQVAYIKNTKRQLKRTKEKLEKLLIKKELSGAGQYMLGYYDGLNRIREEILDVFDEVDERLEAAEEVIRFYADRDNWIEDRELGYLWGDVTRIDGSDEELFPVTRSWYGKETTGNHAIGGKMAREYLKKYTKEK